jgi:glyoxylase-like metal-dependent hydrolase (beta-lactamase superfamily II)
MVQVSLKRRTVASAVVLTLLAVGAAAVQAAQPARRGQAAAPAAAPPLELVTEHVRGNIYMIGGDGGNVTVQIGDEGVLIVDSGFAQNAQALLVEIRKLSKEKIDYIVNTHYHPDHTGGNAVIAPTGEFVGNVRVGVAPRAAIWAHENVLTRVSTSTGSVKEPLIPAQGWPSETYFTASQELVFNDEPIQLIHMPNAHTDGDSVVFFRRADVIATGDLFNTTMYPYIDAAAGGNINGYIDALNRIIDLAIPAANEEGGTMIVSGHGRIADEYDLLVYRDAITIIRDRIADMIARGMTLEQVQAARPSLDYDGIYGATSGFWTTTQFVAAVYNNLKQAK